MKFVHQLDNKVLNIVDARCNHEVYSSIRFNENPSSGSGVFPCGQTDMTKPIDAFRNFAKGD